MNTINYQQRVMFDYDRKVLYFNKRPYALSPVTVSEIATIRKKGKPFFLYKNREELWGTPVPRSLSLIGATGTLGAHMCSYADNVCEYLSAGNDSEGCPKAKNAACCGIENFEFINEGFETLYTRPESLLVLKCCNFKKKKENKKVSPIKLKNMVEELRFFLYK